VVREFAAGVAADWLGYVPDLSSLSKRDIPPLITGSSVRSAPAGRSPTTSDAT
jgi:hypothetical protein